MVVAVATSITPLDEGLTPAAKGRDFRASVVHEDVADLSARAKKKHGT
jgi:hypothetical protein